MKLPPSTTDAVALFERLVPTHPKVETRKLFGQPAAFADGNLFLGVFGPQVFLRLDEADRKQASLLPGARPFEPMAGRPMRAYVVLPMEELAEATRGPRWVDRALRFALTLPPKRRDGAPARVPPAPSPGPRANGPGRAGGGGRPTSSAGRRRRR